MKSFIERQLRMLEPILIITPFFAPQTHAAMFRVHKLVKYLPEHGYRPIVLTTDINYLYNNNEALLAELPECVEIIRTRHIEPSLRGIRMALGGKDRTFSAKKNRTGTAVIRMVPDISAWPSNIFRKVMSAMYSAIVQFFYNIPDAHWTWALASCSTAEELVKKYNIELMYTTANPYCHLAMASKLKEKLGLRWMADFRDPCGYGYKNSVGNYLGSRLQQKYLRDTFMKADKITGLSGAYNSIFSDLYNLGSCRYTFIPTGLDDAYLPSERIVDNSYSNSIVFSGEVMPEQEAYVFKVIQLLQKSNSELNIVIIGRSEINKPIVERLVADISNWVVKINYIDYLPQKKLYRILQSAKACILTPGESRYWWTNFAKMVDYIALGVPVIAHVPELSEARKELKRAGLGFFLHQNSAEQDAMRLELWLQTIDRVNPGTDYRKRYLASSQVAAFAKLFDELKDEKKK